MDTRHERPEPPETAKKWHIPAPGGEINGEGGIRTPDGLQAHTGFRDRRIQPLCHLSKGPMYRTFLIFSCARLKRGGAAAAPRLRRLDVAARNARAVTANGEDGATALAATWSG
jgi:hypothetical protein